jgi:hypothetical protein
MEMKLTFAPFVFAPRDRKPSHPSQTLVPAPIVDNISRLATATADLSRMSLSSLLYYALMGEGATSR